MRALPQSRDQSTTAVMSSSTKQRARAVPGPEDASGALTKKWASPASWDRLRARITQLYTTEGKTLNEVMGIMAREHGHHATTRMYKSRIATWGLMKYKKEDDMMLVLRKKSRREAQGKNTSFTVRGREVSQQDIVEYFARKGGLPNAKKLDLDSDPPTPKHITYYTPPPSPPHSFSSVTISPGTLSPNLSRNTSPPQLYVSSEELYYSISSYFDGSFGNQTFTTDAVGNCISRIAGRSRVSELEHLYLTCQTAIELIKNRRFVEARRILSRTCNGLHILLTDEAEDPRSVEAILQMFLHLRNEGLDQVIKILQNYIVGVADTLARKGGPERMWVKICRMLGNLELSQFEDAIALAWRCATDGFERNLGALHETTLLIHIDYIVWVHGSHNHETEESLLRNLLVKCTPVYSPGSEMILTIQSRIAESLHEQKRYLESEAVALDLVVRARESGQQMQHMLGLELAAISEHAAGKWALAEANLREHIRVVEEVYGKCSLWAIKNWGKLECWLREWGREEEAEGLKREVDKMIGRDEIDAEIGEVCP